MQKRILHQFLLIWFVQCVFAQEKVHIGIFYESLCPDSIRFIKYQLEPIYADFDEFVDIDFVPFGKSRSLNTEKGIEFRCQHGEDECNGNKIHSCALQLAQTQAQQVAFVTCQMSYGADGSDLCAEQAQLPHDQILTCFSSDAAIQLQLDTEAKTKQLAAPRPMLAFVPTIVYNHKYDHIKQDRSLFEFRKVLCEEIQLTSSHAPAICARL